MIQSPVAHGIRSTLVIKQALETDFGPYTCIVENSHGRAELEINLEQQSECVTTSLCMRIIIYIFQISISSAAADRRIVFYFLFVIENKTRHIFIQVPYTAKMS